MSGYGQTMRYCKGICISSSLGFLGALRLGEHYQQEVPEDAKEYVGDSLKPNCAFYEG